MPSFARNQLMLTARRAACDDADWLALLTNPQLRLATSTPGCDPSGDYTWQLFERIEARFPARQRDDGPRAAAGRGTAVAQRPAGRDGGAWLIREGLTDLFIGYAHYASQMAMADDLRTVTIPAPWNIQAIIS
jgi:molybdate transport system substrate-binding protein